MKTLNEAIAGSGENTLLIGSSPVVGTILVFVQKTGVSNFDEYALLPAGTKNWRFHSEWARAISSALISFITGWISWHFMNAFQHIPVR